MGMIEVAVPRTREDGSAVDVIGRDRRRHRGGVRAGSIDPRHRRDHRGAGRRARRTLDREPHPSLVRVRGQRGNIALQVTAIWSDRRYLDMTLLKSEEGKIAAAA
jgi:hypothetical protein